jgi:RecG-like helicase
MHDPDVKGPDLERYDFSPAVTGCRWCCRCTFGKLNIFTTDDLLFHLPRDYEDRSTVIPMNQLVVGRSYLLEGEVKALDFPPGKRKSFTAYCKMTQVKLALRFYHIYKNLTDKLKAGHVYVFLGKFESARAA